jgi:ATP-dependent Lon protease
MTLQGGTLPVLGFADCLQVVTEQRGRRVLILLQNASELSGVPQGIVRRLDFPFYTDPVDATLKALGL